MSSARHLDEDDAIIRESKIEDEFDMLPPNEIKDLKESKPTDWVDEREIVDPEDVKP